MAIPMAHYSTENRITFLLTVILRSALTVLSLVRMAFDDFKTEFQRLEVCYLGPDTLLDDDEGEIADACRKWEGQLMDGGWKSRVNAGGCKNFSQSAWFLY